MTVQERNEKIKPKRPSFYTIKQPSDISGWKDFSMTPHTESEIRARILRNGIESVCVSYICKFSRLSEKFIEELAVLSTGLIRDDYFYEENFKTVYDALKQIGEVRNGYTKYNSTTNVKGMKNKIILKYGASKEKYSVEEKFLSSIQDRIDWSYIAQFQRLSEDFIVRHIKDLPLNKIFVYQNVSMEFRRKYFKEQQQILQ